MKKVIPLTIHNTLYFLSVKEAEDAIESLKTGIKKAKREVKRAN
jgi:hypothetical protein